MKFNSESILYIIIFVYSINKCLSRESLIHIEPSIKVYFNRFIIEEQRISFLNNSYNDYQFSYTGKIIYLSNYSNLHKIEIYNNYYNRNWIFFINSTSELIKFIENSDKKTSDYFNTPILIPKSLNISDKLILKKKYVFTIKDKNFNEMIVKYNFEKFTNNYFFKIEFSYNKLDVPYEYLKHITLFSFSFSTILLIFWKHKFNKATINELVFVCRCSIFFPMIKVVTSLLILVKIKQDTESSYLIGYQKSSMIDFIIIFINLIYKSFFLFFSILVSEGVDLTSSFNQLSEIRSCIRKHTFIYLLLCFDVIIDIMILKISGNISLIEVKNVLEQFLILLIILYKSRITYKLLKRRLFYAISNFEEFIPSLKIKIKLISQFMKINIIHFILYCFFSMIINTIYPIQIFKLVHNNITDSFIAIGYTIVFFPRKWPRFFLDNLKEDVLQYTNIYKVNLNKNKFNLPNFVDKNNPIVIVNPNYFFKGNHNKSKIDKAIFNMKLGVIENENNENNENKIKNVYFNEGIVQNI